MVSSVTEMKAARCRNHAKRVRVVGWLEKRLRELKKKEFPASI